MSDCEAALPGGKAGEMAKFAQKKRERHGLLYLVLDAFETAPAFIAQASLELSTLNTEMTNLGHHTQASQGYWGKLG